MKLLIKYLSHSKRGLREFIYSVLFTIPYQIVSAMSLRFLSMAFGEDPDQMWKWALCMVACCIATPILTMPSTYYYMNSRNVIFRDLEKLFEKKILEADYGFFNEYSPSKVISIEDELKRISQAVLLLNTVLATIITVVVNGLAIGLINPWLLIPITILYTVFGLIFKVSFKGISDAHKESDKIFFERNDERHAVIDGFNEVRAFCKQKEHEASMDAHNAGILNAMRKKNIWERKFDGSIETLYSFVNIAGVAIGIWAIQKGLVTGAVALTTILYAKRMISPMLGMINSIDELSGILSLMPEFDKFMQHENEIKDGKIELTSFNDEIRFDDVSFFYKDSDTVLDDVRLTIKKGQKVGICGSSGGGKTTMLKLLMRFYDVVSGSIRIDGINIQHLTLDSLRKKIGVVSQDPYIFNGTIYENIAYADSKRSEAAVMEAAKKAAIYDFIESLPEGFNTKVGPKGMKLSGGQKQRIALARIFLYNPEIILLDEATSALDNECENIIQESFAGFEGKTVIAVAHRLSTIQDSDKIVVVDNHKIAECGTHDELMAQNGIYAKLYNA